MLESSLLWGHPVPCRVLRNIPGLYPPDARSSPHVMTTNTDCRLYPVSLEWGTWQNHPQLRTTTVDLQRLFDLKIFLRHLWDPLQLSGSYLASGCITNGEQKGWGSRCQPCCTSTAIALSRQTWQAVVKGSFLVLQVFSQQHMIW